MGGNKGAELWKDNGGSDRVLFMFNLKINPM